MAGRSSLPGWKFGRGSGRSPRARRRRTAVAYLTSFPSKCNKNRRHLHRMPPEKVPIFTTSSGGIIRIRFKGRRSTFLSACHTSSPVYSVKAIIAFHFLFFKWLPQENSIGIRSFLKPSTKALAKPFRRFSLRVLQFSGLDCHCRVLFRPASVNIPAPLLHTASMQLKSV